MSVRLSSGLLLAVASAGALNWSYLAQHGEVGKMPPISARRPIRSLRLLFASGRWLVGFLVGVLGWMLYVSALALAPLSLVQAAARATAQRRIRRAQTAAGIGGRLLPASGVPCGRAPKGKALHERPGLAQPSEYIGRLEFPVACAPQIWQALCCRPASPSPWPPARLRPNRTATRSPRRARHHGDRAAVVVGTGRRLGAHR